MIRSLNGAGRVFLLFGATSLAAVGVGVAVCAASGVPAGVWGRNLAAWGVGAVLAAGLALAPRRVSLPVVITAAPAALAACFLSPGQLGVHRWIAAGPLYINAALLLLPAFVVALAGLTQTHRWPWIAAIAAAVLLTLQPDRSHSLALAAAAAVILAGVPRQAPPRIGLITALGILFVIAWQRPDPLRPVPEVEGVVGLAWTLSPIAAAAMLLALGATAAVPVLATRQAGPAAQGAGRALGLYLAVVMAMPFLGAFPVPLAGMGLSPVIGAWLGTGLLAGLVRDGR